MKTIKELLTKAKCPNPTGVAFAIKEHVEKLIDEVLHKVKGKVIERDIGEYDKLVSCWDIKEELKKRIDGEIKCR